MVVPRAIKTVLLALLAAGSTLLLLPPLSTATQPPGSGHKNQGLLHEEAIPSHQQRASYAAPAATVDDAVILLGVTGSMRGQGPDARARNIWENTLDAVADIVDRLALQTNLALVPFSTGPEWSYVYPGLVATGGQLSPRQLAAGSDREAFEAHLRKLVADGEATWIYESLQYSLTQLRHWREADPGRTHRHALFLYSDGIDNGPHGEIGIDGPVQLIRAQKANSSNLYLVYNDLASYGMLDLFAKDRLPCEKVAHSKRKLLLPPRPLRPPR